MPLTEFAAGEELAADDLNRIGGYGTLVARGRRTTSSTAASSEQSVLRVDDIPVINGHVYYITTNPMLIDTSVANDVARILLRIDETGSAATTSSTNIAIIQVRLADASNSELVMAGTSRTASADGSWSVLLSHTRQAGSGNIQIAGASSTPIELLIYDCGIDPGDTGVDL